MDPSPNEDVVKTIQKILDPYIRPREEVAHIRRILALHLNSCVDDGIVADPLALVDAAKPASLSTARGLHRDYLEALNANIQARNEYKAQIYKRTPQLEEEVADSVETGQDTIQEHLSIIQLQKKRERLEVIQKHLELLKRKPAASEGFMKSEEIFKDSRPLPKVPGDLVTALGLDRTATSAHLKDLIDQLEKHVLRTKLLLKREEQLLEQVKSRSTTTPDTITDSAKLEALSKTRVELISWIETELSKASKDDTDGAGGDPAFRKSRGPINPINMDDQLASIKEKYTQYTEARKALLQLVSQQPKPDIKPRSEDQESQSATSFDPAPSAHLLAPYLEQLLAISREQKGLITQKSHLNNTIVKQVKENCRILDHLAAESQLIPAHPMPGAGRSKSGFSEAVSTAADKAEVSGRIQPWVFAADAAKIATLETAAEKIDEGQIAVESSMRTLAEMDVLLGKEAGKQKQDGEEDLWLDGSQQPENTRKHTDKRGSKVIQPKTVFDMLDGNLGLLRSEQEPL
ncbi:hypothetical protein QBC38DRAFT_478234 [Podospora fimiseda]|uniref:Uncharacterized protein n=1 Tax=Podospora fimiseda TaxID=252190 RepID=A0AAN7H4C4_9PEZI|nr:hypothetical protein QBC38DRAFT_478234 [Podospora fimiseda]